MRRITIEETRAARDRTGYHLVQHITLDTEKRCGCPLGVIAVADADDPGGRQFSCPDLDTGYRFGLIDGFDGIEGIEGGRLGPTIDRKTYNLGVGDGTAIRRALLPVAQ